MINRFKHNILLIFFLGILGLLLQPLPGQAQFIDLRLDIDSELTATTEQPLDFGTLPTNGGRQYIEMGSLKMGIFSITALENQLLLVDLHIPKVLRHNNPAIDDVVPVELFARYGYSSQHYQTSVPLPANTSDIKVEANPDPGPWNSIFIFIYGAVNVGNVPDGMYANEIVLNVEYI